MKLPVIENVVESIVSRPARGAWIEITAAGVTVAVALVSRPARGAWIEIAIWSAQAGLSVSRPARGAWIEIGGVRERRGIPGVAPREGRVD